MSEYIVDYESVPLKWRDGYGLSDIDLTEEIVRCRDCKYCIANVCMSPDGDGDYLRFEVLPGGFCAWGVRK